MTTKTKQKNWVVRIYYNHSVAELPVIAERSIDARRSIKTQYSECRVLTVTEINSLAQYRNSHAMELQSI